MLTLAGQLRIQARANRLANHRLHAAMAALSEEARAVVEKKAVSAGMEPGELLGLIEEQLPPLEGPARERLEALSFTEAAEMICLLGASKTGWRSMVWLAENRGD